MSRETIPTPAGRVRVHRVYDNPAAGRPARPYPAGWRPLTPFVPNLVLYEWGAIFARLLTGGQPQYRISHVYFEYENVGDPDDAVSPPAFGREPSAGVDYYNALSGSADRDYLRVPLIAATVGVSDADNFPKGNVATFFAQTSGVQGVHGKPFSDANNSKVFGGALVAAVDEDDSTQDLVMSRFYLPTAEQQVKLASSQIGFEWELAAK